MRVEAPPVQAKNASKIDDEDKIEMINFAQYCGNELQNDSEFLK